MKIRQFISKYIFLISVFILLTGCFSYYQKNIQLEQAFENKNFVKAENILDNKKWEKRKHNILLYYLNKGTVLHMLGKYKESNEYFQKADFFIEDYHKNYGITALSLLSNPSIEPYIGENYEKILLHYYSTLNYLQLNDPDGALIECKRMLIMMQNITTYYKNNNKYNRDAFTDLLLGIVYDANNDFENAFIAYRNAYEIYRDDYKPLLGTDIPIQLKKDLLRTAYLNGSYSELELYEKEFGFQYDRTIPSGSSLVCFWNNGVCPVKEQSSITFVITNMGNGYVLFTNLELGITLPFFIGDDKNKIDNLVKMKILRITFPKFVSRPPIFQNAFIKTANEEYPLEIAENIDAIAFRSLHDRMLKELGETLLRFALKRVEEMEVQKNNKDLSVALNIVNTITEKADTRNWQMLPYSINYTRVNLKDGRNDLTMHSVGNNISTVDSLTINVTTNKTYFQSFLGL